MYFLQLFFQEISLGLCHEHFSSSFVMPFRLYLRIINLVRSSSFRKFSLYRLNIFNEDRIVFIISVVFKSIEFLQPFYYYFPRHFVPRIFCRNLLVKNTKRFMNVFLFELANSIIFSWRIPCKIYGTDRKHRRNTLRIRF